MNNTYCENWDRTRERFSAWWEHEKIGYPLLRITAAGKPPQEFAALGGASVKTAAAIDFANSEEKYTNAVKITERYRNYCETHWFWRIRTPM